LALTEISGFGKLSIAKDASAPLLLVFGGIDVGGVQSGVYMWPFMTSIDDKFHIFVALNNHVNGTRSYSAVKTALQAQSLTPSKHILYLFSGGYRPGMDVLTSDKADAFASISLVDIWMGVTQKSGSIVPDFYKAEVTKNTAKFSYVYTSFGANNDSTRDYIANKLGSQRAVLVKGQKGEDSMQTHMRTNTVAIGML
jgi:hypothetical protein